MKNLLNRFLFAINGLKLFISSEKNGQLQLIAGTMAIMLSVYFNINEIEWCAVLLCIALVITLEMLNSTIEKICDIISPEINNKIKWIKDVAAGAVLFSAIISAIIGFIIFLPKIFTIYNHAK